MTNSCRDILNKQWVSIREVAALVGLMGAYSTASDFGANHAKFLELDRNRALKQNSGNFDATMMISHQGKLDIAWRLFNIQSLVQDFPRRKWDLKITPTHP